MKVVSITTFDIGGGAARAGFRQHEALRRAGVDHWILAGKKLSADPFTVEAPPMRNSYVRSRQASLVRQFAIDRNRTALSDTWFSFPLRDTGLAEIEQVRSADIIDVQWSSAFVSLDGLEELFALGKPVTFTLHDQWAYTGGCHYTAGCERYLTDCRGCPQLAVDPIGVPAITLQLRKSLGAARRGTVIGPSRWMHETARRAPVFAGWRHEHLPMPLDTGVFVPRNRAEAQRHLGLGPGPWRVLFVAERVAEKRKGFSDLLEAGAKLGLIAGRPVHFVAMGTAPDRPADFGVRIQYLGKLDDQKDVAAAYSAADVMLLPSHEDNLPNTMLEALACGTPVIGYDIGGLPDAVRPGLTGKLVPVGDVGALAGAIREVLESGASESWRGSCRSLAEAEFSYSVHARRCIALYEDILRNHKASAVGPAGTGYDRVLWDACLQLTVNRLELRDEFSNEDKKTIMAGRMEYARLADPSAGVLRPGSMWV